MYFVHCSIDASADSYCWPMSHAYKCTTEVPLEEINVFIDYDHIHSFIVNLLFAFLCVPHAFVSLIFCFALITILIRTLYHHNVFMITFDSICHRMIL